MNVVRLCSRMHGMEPRAHGLGVRGRRVVHCQRIAMIQHPHGPFERFARISKARLGLPFFQTRRSDECR